MLILLDEDLPSRREIRHQQQKLEDCQEEAMGVMEALMDKYLTEGYQEGVKKINEELEIIERECTSAQNRAQEYLDSRAHEESSIASGKSARMKMSQVKKDQIEHWRIESDERRKHLRQLEKDRINKRQDGQDGPQSNQIQNSDGEQTLSTVSKNDSQVALRTVPVILSNGKNKLVVNALLDDGSTKSYVNSDVAFQLQTHGSVQRIQVGVLNGKTETLDVMPVELMVESLD